MTIIYGILLVVFAGLMYLTAGEVGENTAYHARNVHADLSRRYVIDLLFAEGSIFLCMLMICGLFEGHNTQFYTLGFVLLVTFASVANTTLWYKRTMFLLAMEIDPDFLDHLWLGVEVQQKVRSILVCIVVVWLAVGGVLLWIL
jgi:hypothetical protein